MTRQLYEQLQLKIIRGELPSEYRLPSSRTLAEELHISRNLVTEVYDTLKVEGFIESKSGSGTFVSSHAFLKTYTDRKINLETYQKTFSKDIKTEEIRFETGIPYSLFPIGHWGKCLRDASIYSSADILDYGHNDGLPQLQKSLSQWLTIHKGIHSQSRQIFIFSGTHQAIDLLLELFSGQILFEDPNLPSIRSKAKKVFPVEGPNRALLITPSHSYPLGQIMTIQKRIELLEKAEEEDCLIIENDYDGELIYKGPVLSSIQLLAPEKVIHLGSLNGTMYPGLRLSYMIVPEALLGRVSLLKNEMGFICPIIEQLAMARFIDNGYYDDHLIKLKKHFSKLYNFLSRLLSEFYGDRVEIIGIGAGQYLTARFPGVNFRGDLTDKMKEAGLYVQFVYDCTDNPSKYDDTLTFSFGKLNQEQIRTGIKILKQIL